MDWTLKTLSLWPPGVTIEPGRKDVDALHAFFVELEDRRLLRHGYGPPSGIRDLDDLALRIDQVRDYFRDALRGLAPKASVADWLRQAQGPWDELLSKVYAEMSGGRQQPDDLRGLTIAVNQVRDVTQSLAEQVASKYNLPAAESVATRIAEGRSGRHL